MQKEQMLQLQKKACLVRQGIIESVYNAKSGHPGGSLSIADVLTYLYFAEMNVDPQNPKMMNRDRLVLSKGHCTPGLYSVLALKGFFPIEELKTFRKIGSRLQGHPDMKNIPGVDMSTGSLGQGISAACGMALGSKASGNDFRVYTILGDGEIEEGQVWEAAMLAGNKKLDNLCAIIDYNGLQIDGTLSEVCSPEPIDEKFRSFGWNAIVIDAHDFEQYEKAFNEAKNTKGKPTVIIQKSIKGKGVSYMENVISWHGAAPNEEQYEIAMKEINDVLKGLEA